jgi:TadE-like protein
MRNLNAFLRDEGGGPAAEFAMVLPIALIFLFGIIDVGRYMWDVNQAEKATQTGARWAAATDVIATDLAAYSFTLDGGILQGEPIPEDKFPGVVCMADGCGCESGGTCDFDATLTDTAAFTALVGRMAMIKPDIIADNVVVHYDWSGIGYAGNPNGADVAPLVTIQLRNMTFKSMLLRLIGVNIELPDYGYSLTMEDGYGSVSN